MSLCLTVNRVAYKAANENEKVLCACVWHTVIAEIDKRHVAMDDVFEFLGLGQNAL